jgi:hypothetical protein
MHEIGDNLAAYRRYTIREVAQLLNISNEYFWQCLRAAMDERFRKDRKIPRSTLLALPLRNWSRQGRKWVIDEASLLAQIGASRKERRH